MAYRALWFRLQRVNGDIERIRARLESPNPIRYDSVRSSGHSDGLEAALDRLQELEQEKYRLEQETAREAHRGVSVDEWLVVWRANGLTVSALADALGVSERTIRRRLSRYTDLKNEF